MKIVWFISGDLSGSYGGGQIYVKNLLQGFAAKQTAVAVLAFIDSDNDLRVEKCNFNGHTVYQFCGRRQQWPAAAADLLREIAPEIIHAHGEKALAIDLGRQLLIPCIVTAHHGGIICPAGGLLDCRDRICRVPVSDQNCLRCVCRDIPGSVFWYQLLRCLPPAVRLRLAGMLPRQPFIPFLTPVLAASQTIDQKLKIIQSLRGADQIIAPCEAMREAFARNGITGNVVTLPHGIPPLPKLPLPPATGKIRFFYLGRICHGKGLHVMLEAFRGISADAYELHILGEAVTKAERRYLARLRRQAQTVNVIWHGKIGHDKLQELLAGFEVMVHPAIFLEIYGLTIAEAMSSGRPVVATRCGGPETQIRDGQNGWLIPPNDPAALRQKIKDIIARPQSIAEAAQTCATESLTSHVEQLSECYLKVINHR